MRLMLCFSALALTACHGEPIKVNAPPPPQERLVCDPLPTPPDLSPLVAFTTPDGVPAYRKADVDARDAQIAPYVVQMRSAWFSCSSQLQWNADYWKGNE